MSQVIKKNNFHSQINVTEPNFANFCSSKIVTEHKELNHLGFIVAGIEELGIIETINRLMPPEPGQIVSHGHRVAAIITNFLSGSGQQRLYVTPAFYKNVAVDRLFGKDIKPEHLNDDALGRTLDLCADYGPSKLFNTIMMIGAEKANLISKFNHLDTTSISVYGKYEEKESRNAISLTDTTGSIVLGNDDNEAMTLKINRGYSKDHRPDLQQIVLCMMINGPAKLPLLMSALDGNTSDKTYFPKAFEMAKKAFIENLEDRRSFIWVADAALFTSSNLKRMAHQRLLWISRVPNSIREAKALCKKSIPVDEWVLCSDKNYQIHESIQEYTGIRQRWLLVFSRQAYERDALSFQDKIEREKKSIEKVQKSISRQTFLCKADAKKAVKKAFSKFKYHRFQAGYLDVPKHRKVGRPTTNTKPKASIVKVNGTIHLRHEAIESATCTHGKFIIATNVMDVNILSAEEALIEYKKQSTCEGAFKFFKSVDFKMDIIFLKNPKRIAAMMAILCLAIAVANLIEYKLRMILAINNDSIPDKAKKPTQKITFGLLAFHMRGVGISLLGLENTSDRYSVMSTLNDLQKKLIKYFGATAENIYFGLGESFCSGFT